MKMVMFSNSRKCVPNCAEQLYSKLRACSVLPDLLQSFTLEVKPFHDYMTTFSFKKVELMFFIQKEGFHLFRKWSQMILKMFCTLLYENMVVTCCVIDVEIVVSALNMIIDFLFFITLVKPTWSYDFIFFTEEWSFHFSSKEWRLQIY